MRILVIIGMPASGKTSIAETAKELGIFTISTGDIVREEIKRRGMDYNEASDKEISEWFHEYGRERELMRRIVDKIVETGNPDSIVIEGFRSLYQINELKKRVWGEKISILAVHAPPQVRWERERMRARFDHKGYRNVRARDERELSFGVGELIAMADYVVINDSSLEKFKQTVKNKLIEILNIKER